LSRRPLAPPPHALLFHVRHARLSRPSSDRSLCAFVLRSRGGLSTLSDPRFPDSGISDSASSPTRCPSLSTKIGPSSALSLHTLWPDELTHELKAHELLFRTELDLERAMTLMKFLEDSGVLVIPLLACSVIALTVVLERFFYWLILWSRRNESIRRRILSGDTRLSRCRDRVAEVLKEYVDHPDDASVARVEAERLMRESRRYLKVLSWVATLSTSLGLLGTVVGVSMALKDLDDPAKLTPALAIALNTTIIGLVIYPRHLHLRELLSELLAQARGGDEGAAR
jgi:biopolymer transport protein ExbB